MAGLAGCAQLRGLTSGHTAQVAREAAELRRQQGLLRTAFEGEVQRTSAECTGGVEAMQTRWRQVSPTRQHFAPAVMLGHVLPGMRCAFMATIDFACACCLGMPWDGGTCM